MKDVDPEDNGPFPFVPNMIECHGFDAVFGGMAKMVSMPCKKMEGPCTIWTCRKACGPVVQPMVVPPVAPVEKKWPGLFDEAV